MSDQSWIDVIDALRRFRDDREWGEFHTPKDLSIAVSTEAAELLEHFLWRDGQLLQDHIDAHYEELAAEIADIGIYLTYLCDALGVDLLAAMESKRRINESRIPIAESRGRARLSD